MKRCNLFFILFFCLLAISCGGSGNTAEVGKTLPDWSEGYLDIHAINTGRGESSLLIFPDGTTMLVDAASANMSYDNPIPPSPMKPNEESDPAQTISDYVSHFTAPASGRLNYMMLSHWHGDHIGGALDTVTMARHPAGFILCGVTRVGTNVRVDKFIDRGYTYPTDITALYPAVANYVKFMDWAEQEYPTGREEFRVGVTDQIVMTENPAKYGNFEIRNVVGNGVVWTGEGDETRNTFSENIDEVIQAASKPGDNIFSLGFHLKYGDFDFFTAGDLQYSGSDKCSWFDIEAPVAEVVPVVEVMKANHHGTKNCNSEAYLGALKPDAVIVHVWRDVQPNSETVGRVFAANPDCRIFTTNMSEDNKVRLGDDVVSRIASMSGHVVVRVSPGGKKYYIYVLDDTNEDYVVREIFGPYQCN